MKKIYIFIVFILFIGCSSKTVTIKDISNSTSSKYKFYSSLSYDSYGLPKFDGSLYVRPTQANIRYYIVEYRNSKMVSFFLINTTEADGNYEYAMNLIYEDTAKGFNGGVQVSQSMLSAPPSGSSGAAGVVYLGVLISAPIIGTAGGFLYGLGHSSMEFVKQINEDYFVEYKENIILYSELYYDENSRLRYLHEYNDEKKRVKTREYTYNVKTLNICQTDITKYGKKSTFFKETCK